MQTRIPVLVALLATICACAGPRPSKSELEWQRGQCAQVIDRDAREKCIERVNAQ